MLKVRRAVGFACLSAIFQQRLGSFVRSFAQTHARPAVILVNEVDAGIEPLGVANALWRETRPVT
jgi:hypothetical protein